jgi:hypothetical protein
LHCVICCALSRSPPTPRGCVDAAATASLQLGCSSREGIQSNTAAQHQHAVCDPHPQLQPRGECVPSRAGASQHPRPAARARLENFRTHPRGLPCRARMRPQAPPACSQQPMPGQLSSPRAPAAWQQSRIGCVQRAGALSPVRHQPQRHALQQQTQQQAQQQQLQLLVEGSSARVRCRAAAATAAANGAGPVSAGLAPSVAAHEQPSCHVPCGWRTPDPRPRASRPLATRNACAG